MNFSWLLNGTMEAHHLMAVYLLVWLIQGGYALWIARQFMRAGKDSTPPALYASTKREPS